MLNKKISAFIDESGDPRFNEGASSHLEFSAILIDSELQDNIALRLNDIKKELGLKELKSSKIKTEKRRIQILEAIKEVDFKFINLYFDKSKVVGKWKENPQVVYKYTQKILNSELHRLFPNRNVTIDKFGDEKYQKSIKEYLNKAQQLDMFDNIINIDSAKDNVLIQLADLIAGTYRKLRKNEFKKHDLINSIISQKELHVIVWPDNFNRYFIGNIANPQDKLIADISISTAERYLEKIEKSQNPRKLTLEYLLFQVKFNDFRKYIFSAEIIDWLKHLNYNVSEEEFRKDIIGKLRDDGVVIVGSRSGLKIPISSSELIEYIDYASGRYITMIRRLKETYKTLNASSLGEVGVFNANEFEIHKEFFKILEKY